MGDLLTTARPVLRAAGWDGVAAALVVSGAEQQIYLLRSQAVPHRKINTQGEQGESDLVGVWPVSTAVAGFGNRQDSGQTPVGLHRIAACIGAGSPCGMVFKSRLPTGTLMQACIEPAGDFITTRILWLEGLEEGINRGTGCDSRARYIYIHGTPYVSLLGQPVSAGCIRMDDRHILELFAQVQTGTLVWIVPSATLQS